MAGPTTRGGPLLEIRGGVDALRRLFALLEDAVVVRPDGETFHVVRDGDGLRYTRLDLTAFIKQDGPPGPLLQPDRDRPN